MALRATLPKAMHVYPLRSPNFKQRADKAFWRPWTLFPFLHTQYPMTDALKSVRRRRLETERPAEAWRWDTHGAVWLPNEHEQEEYNSLPYVGVGHLYEELAGTKSNPIILYFSGAEDDEHYFACSGDCSPNMGKCARYFRIWGNQTMLCPDCGQHFFAKCVEDVILDPDCPRNWPDHPRFKQPLLFEEVEELVEEWLDRGVEVMLY